MATIYLSHTNSDLEFARDLGRHLIESGHIIQSYTETLTPGQDWRKALSDSLKSSDVYIPIISEQSLNSKFLLTEFGSARAYASDTGGMLIIPVIIDQIPYPEFVQDIQAIHNPKRNVAFICNEVNKGIAAFIGRRAAKEQKQEAASKRLETNATQYIEEALKSLQNSEAKLKNRGEYWYLVGILIISSGIGFTLYALSTYNIQTDYKWTGVAIVALKTAIIVTLLAAAAKYSFILGKSYTCESLKSSDRIHAISFGKFYLQAFEVNSSWSELKEVFQHWNIDKPSSFSTQDAAQFDPKLLDTVLEVAKSIAAKKEEKK
jgi:hypothetical protein